jgi:hypothetical protein
MMELLLIRGKNGWDITNLVQSVEWSGRKFGAPRKVSFPILLKPSNGSNPPFKMDYGDYIIFKWKGKELFRGTVFTIDGDDTQVATITAYDQLYYFVNNMDSYTFENQKASDILTRICRDFLIPIGSITDTGYKINTLIQEDKTLYDIVLKSLDTTYKQTGTRYNLFDDQGKVNLRKRTDNLTRWVLEVGANITGYTYSFTIEESANRIKLVKSGEGSENIIVVEENKSLQPKWGVLQYYESISDDLNRAQMQERGKTLLKKMAKEKKDFSLSSLGIPEVISGSAVHVIIPETEIQNGFYVDEDIHVFEGKKHAMTLALTYTDELPELE